MSWLRRFLRKRNFQEANKVSKKPRVAERQTRRDALDVRETALSPEALHLASAQEYAKIGHWDAHFVEKMLAENPEKYGPFLREACKHIDEKQKPTIPAENMLATVLHKKVPGLLLLILYSEEANGFRLVKHIHEKCISFSKL